MVANFTYLQYDNKLLNYHEVCPSGRHWITYLYHKVTEFFFVSVFRTDSGLWLYHLSARSNFNPLHYSQWITIPTQSCLLLYSIWASVLHSLIMRLTILPLSPHSLHIAYYHFSLRHNWILWHYLVLLSTEIIFLISDILFAAISVLSRVQFP